MKTDANSIKALTHLHGFDTSLVDDDIQWISHLDILVDSFDGCQEGSEDSRKIFII
jgi:hypothetical protein